MRNFENIILDLIGEQAEKKESGFFDLPKMYTDACRHREHNPPGHMVIPRGQGYRHVCPGCGAVRILMPHQITM